MNFEIISKCLGNSLFQVLTASDTPVYYIKNCIHLPLVVNFLKNSILGRYKVLILCTAVDYPKSRNRFELVYNLLSLQTNSRLILKCSVAESDLVPSLTFFYPVANWYEREIWDMFGIVFKDHSDLRRILTDYGFQGHPLRKDFPLTGYIEVQYKESEKRVVQTPVQLKQAYRNFQFQSPWESSDK